MSHLQAWYHLFALCNAMSGKTLENLAMSFPNPDCACLSACLLQVTFQCPMPTIACSLWRWLSRRVEFFFCHTQTTSLFIVKARSITNLNSCNLHFLVGNPTPYHHRLGSHLSGCGHQPRHADLACAQTVLKYDQRRIFQSSGCWAGYCCLGECVLKDGNGVGIMRAWLSRCLGVQSGGELVYQCSTWGDVVAGRHGGSKRIASVFLVRPPYHQGECFDADILAKNELSTPQLMTAYNVSIHQYRSINLKSDSSNLWFLLFSQVFARSSNHPATTHRSVRGQLGVVHEGADM